MASMALPPFARISRPASAAWRLAAATMKLLAPARSAIAVPLARSRAIVSDACCAVRGPAARRAGSRVERTRPGMTAVTSVGLLSLFLVLPARERRVGPGGDYF